jgi:hypothetical protein
MASYTSADYDNSANCYISQIHIQFYSLPTASSSVTLFHSQLVHLSSYKQTGFYMNFVETVIMPEEYLIGNNFKPDETGLK